MDPPVSKFVIRDDNNGSNRPLTTKEERQQNVFLVILLLIGLAIMILVVYVELKTPKLSPEQQNNDGADKHQLHDPRR